jgi:uncharacterized protein YeaO (DUF488 family)
MIRLKRVYDPPEDTDGTRILVERLWPRGISREEAHLDEWLKEVAPSAELRKWYSHVVTRWPEFRRRYEEELRVPEKRELVKELAERARRGAVTLVFAARDSEHSSAEVLKEFIERQFPG